MRFFAEHGIRGRQLAYNKVIEYTFERYPLYAAHNLVNLVLKEPGYFFEVDTRTQRLQKAALAIVKYYNMLHIVENDQKLIKTIINNINLLNLFLNYNEKFVNVLNTKEYIHAAIKTRNVNSLILLKEKGIDFGDPELIDTALQTKNFASVSFILDQQKKDLPESYNFSHQIDFKSTFVDKEIFPEYDKEMYKVLAKIRCKVDFSPLDIEILVLDIQKLSEIVKRIEKVRAICSNFWYRQKTINCDEVENLINEKIIPQLFDYKFLSFLQRNPSFLPKLLTKVKQ